MLQADDSKVSGASQFFRGYVRKQVPTADVKVGDLVYFVGAGMLVPIAAIDRDTAGNTILWGAYEAHGRRRSGYIRRRADGRSTIHVRAEAEQ